MPEIGGGLVLNIYRKPSQQSQSTIPPPRRQTQGRRTEMTAGGGLELHKDLKFSPKSGPTTASAAVRQPPTRMCEHTHVHFIVRAH